MVHPYDTIFVQLLNAHVLFEKGGKIIFTP